MVIIGAGTIGTALGHVLAGNHRIPVILLSIEKDVVSSINEHQCNERYFPTFRLHPGLTATLDTNVLRETSIIFLAIPSVSLVEYLDQIKKFISEQALLVNLAKGFGCGHQTIVEFLLERFPNPVAAMKGPTFAREIINGIPAGFTLGITDMDIAAQFMKMFSGTSIYLDHTRDIIGVEILSILKNMYAIVLGIIDAQFNSPNIRFLVLTKAFREMRKVLLFYGGQEDTLFRYCGYGDFTMTALNDLSRNRTLGLLIGKGFFTEQMSHELVLEGKTAIQVFYEELSRKVPVKEHFPILSELYRLLHEPYPVTGFAKTILEVEEV